MMFKDVKFILFFENCRGVFSHKIPTVTVQPYGDSYLPPSNFVCGGITNCYVKTRERCTKEYESFYQGRLNTYFVKITKKKLKVFVTNIKIINLCYLLFASSNSSRVLFNSAIAFSSFSLLLLKFC